MTVHRTTVRRTATLAVALFALLSPALATAGPWVQDPGEGYAKLSGELFRSNKHFDVDGELQSSGPSYSHWAVRGYAEIGVAPRVGLAASTPFVWATNTRENDEQYRRSAFGDLDVRADVQLLESTCALAASVQGRFPLYEGMVEKGDMATASMSGEEKFEPLVGDGSIELTPSAAAGCPLPIPGWAQLQVGPNFRFGGFGNGLSYSASSGVFLVPKRFALKVLVSGLERFSSNNPRPTKRYVNVGGGLIFQWTSSLALEGSFQYTPEGAFVARGWSSALGFSYDGRIFANPY